jgi:polyphenol oxidase
VLMTNVLEKKPIYYGFAPFLKEGVRAGFTNRKFNFSRKNNPGLENNHSVLLDDLFIHNSKIISVDQVHGAGIYLYAKDPLFSSETKADAIVTDFSNVVLTVRLADCLGILLLDRARRVIAVVHSGWRGTKGSIASKTVKFMSEHFNSKTQDLLAAFSPCIRNCCYEVKSEFNEFAGSLIRREGKLYFDLIEENSRQLLDSGIAAENIFDCGFCTSCQNDEFFSFRKEGEASGRSVAFITIKE